MRFNGNANQHSIGSGSDMFWVCEFATLKPGPPVKFHDYKTTFYPASMPITSDNRHSYPWLNAGPRINEAKMIPEFCCSHWQLLGSKDPDLLCPKQWSSETVGRLVVWNGLEHILFSHILGMSSSQLTNSNLFQRGFSSTSNHYDNGAVFNTKPCSWMDDWCWDDQL